MVWIRLDDQIAHHPKILAAGPVAAWLWVCGNGYCNKYLTDGFIPHSVLRTLGAIKNPAKYAEVLMQVGLWQSVPGGYRVHDFHDYNPSAQDVRANRDWDRRRKELYRDPTVIQTIRNRDRNRCRYCGKLVNWKDRRGPDGGQFAHVIPRGPNTPENVVVACRGCNYRKGDHLPEECGMRLLPEPLASETEDQIEEQKRLRSDLSAESSSGQIPTVPVPSIKSGSH